MKYIRINSIEDPLFIYCWQIYIDSFPLCERRAVDCQAKALKSPNYSFYAAMNEMGVVGFVAFWQLRSNMLFLEHIAMSKSRRSEGSGTQVIEFVKSFGLPVIAEIDPVVDSTTTRRRDFYLRCSFVENQFAHSQPPFRVGEKWIPLVVMSYPEALTSYQYDLFSREQIELCDESLRC